MGHIHKLISLFMRNPMSEDMQGLFAQWLLSEDDKEEKLKALETEWDIMSHEVREDSVSSVARWTRLKRLHRKMGYRKGGPLSGRGVFVSWGVVAACLACMLILPAAAFFLFSGEPEQPLTCYVTSSSGKGDFTLPDGTRVWLNSGSKIEFRGDLSEGERKVALYGEAFFDVTPSDRHFVVDMGDVDVRVLGTEFNARNTDVYGDYQVTLSEGRIQVESESFAPIVLSPGQQFSAPRSLETAYVKRVDADDFSSWTKNSITFENRTLEDILTNLEHWYNVDIEIAEDVDRNTRISLTLRHEPLLKTMELICTLTQNRCVCSDPKHIFVTSK